MVRVQFRGNIPSEGVDAGGRLRQDMWRSEAFGWWMQWPTVEVRRKVKVQEQAAVIIELVSVY